MACASVKASRKLSPYVFIIHIILFCSLACSNRILLHSRYFYQRLLIDLCYLRLQSSCACVRDFVCETTTTFTKLMSVRSELIGAMEEEAPT